MMRMPNAMPMMALVEPVPVPMLKTVPCAEIAVDAMLDLQIKENPPRRVRRGKKKACQGLCQIEYSAITRYKSTAAS